MFNALKVLIFGGKPSKERRRLPRARKIPAQETYITKQQIAIKVTEKMSQNLWDWFVLLGWREIDITTNRRKIRRLHDDTFAKFAQATAPEREVLHQNLFNK